MDLATLSKSYGDFYVPAFAVRLGTEDLLRDHAVAITQAEVDLSLGAAGRFSFTIVNSFDLEKREFRTGRNPRDLLGLVAFGAPIEIRMGYGDARKLPLLISGRITEITTSFGEGGSPELGVSGYDHAFPMTGGKNTRNWKDKRDSDAASEIASINNLDADIVETPGPPAQIEQNQESDLEFLKKLAERNGFEFYVAGETGKTLRFGPPQNSGQGVVTLEWGKGLLSFKPEGNIAGQISGVEVYGWDPKAKKPIIGKALHGEEPGRDPRRDSAGDRLRRIVRDQPLMRVRQPVFSEADAKNRAKALLKERAEQFLKGEGETLGLPELRPDRNVTLAGLGRTFSKTYYVEQTTHRFDGGGYRTRFKVKEPTL